jgi:hypothetical protein
MANPLKTTTTSEKCTYTRSWGKHEECKNPAIMFAESCGKVEDTGGYMGSWNPLRNHKRLHAYCVDHIAHFLSNLDRELTYDEYIILKVMES